MPLEHAGLSSEVVEMAAGLCICQLPTRVTLWDGKSLWSIKTLPKPATR